MELSAGRLSSASVTSSARAYSGSRPDLAALELGDENPLWPAGQQSRQAGLAHVQGQSAQILGLTYARRDP